MRRTSIGAAPGFSALVLLLGGCGGDGSDRPGVDASGGSGGGLQVDGSAGQGGGGVPVDATTDVGLDQGGGTDAGSDSGPQGRRNAVLGADRGVAELPEHPNIGL